MSIEMRGDKTQAIADTARISISLYDSIDTVPEQDWRRFVPEANPLLQPSYLRLIEDTQKGEMEFIYALVQQSGSLIGVCYFQVVHFRGTNLIPYYPKDNFDTALNSIKTRLLNLTKGLVARIDIPLLVSGNLFITGEQGLYFLDPITEAQKSYYLAHTIKHIFSQRGHLKTALLPDMYEPSGDFDRAFKAENYQRIYVEADMSMALPQSWHSFDDYMNAIHSKYRVRAKKIMHQSEAIIYQEMEAEEVARQEDRLFGLYKQVADKADFNIAKFPKSYFVAQKRLAPALYKIFGYYLNGELVGFMSLFILPHKTEVHYCGIDYSINKEYALYQRMLYDTVRYATENKLCKLHFGRTAPEVKSTIGAIPHPMYGYLKHKNPIINSIMGLFTDRLKPRAYTLRNPFK